MLNIFQIYCINYNNTMPLDGNFDEKEYIRMKEQNGP